MNNDCVWRRNVVDLPPGFPGDIYKVASYVFRMDTIAGKFTTYDLYCPFIIYETAAVC